MPECPSCGYKSSSEWNYCVRCGTPRSATNNVLNYKFVVMGSGGVGKSALTLRFVHGNFIHIYDPTIEDRYTKHIEYDGDEVMIDLLDTAGQDTFCAMRELYMLNGDGFLFVYSITQRWSFVQLKDFYLPLQHRRIRNTPPLVLVGNKCDLEVIREVSTQEAAARAADWEADHMETSAKTGENMLQIFHALLRRLKEQNKPPVRRRRACVLL